MLLFLLFATGLIIVVLFILREPKEMPIAPKHIPPNDILYKGGYVRVNKCSSCNAIGHDWNWNSHEPCSICGGNVRPDGVAEFTDIDGMMFWVHSKTSNTHNTTV